MRQRVGQRRPSARNAFIGRGNGDEARRLPMHQMPRCGEIELIPRIRKLLMQHGGMGVQPVEVGGFQRVGIGVDEFDQRLVKTWPEMRLYPLLQFRPGEGLPLRRPHSLRPFVEPPGQFGPRLRVVRQTRGQ